MTRWIATILLVALAAAPARAAQPDPGARVRPAHVALFVLTRASPGAELASVAYREGGWTLQLRNVYACRTAINDSCHTFPSVYFLVNDRLPLRVSGWGLP